MAAFTVEFDDKGELVGDQPTELTALLTRIESSSYNRGYGKGVEKAALDAKKQIEDNVKAEVARINAMAPLEAEKHARIADENTMLQARLNEVMKDGDRALKAREEAHAREIVARTEKLEKRETRIKELTRAQIRAEALAYGARDESLPELEVIINSMVGYSDDMEPFVKGADDQPLVVHGKAVGLSQYVKQYLDGHPHHRKAPAGTPGNARGGASYYGGSATATKEAALARIESGDRSPGAINELFEAGRQRKAS